MMIFQNSTKNDDFSKFDDVSVFSNFAKMRIFENSTNMIFQNKKVKKIMTTKLKFRLWLRKIMAEIRSKLGNF